MVRVRLLVKLAGIAGVTIVAVAALLSGINHEVALIAMILIGSLAGATLYNRASLTE